MAITGLYKIFDHWHARGTVHIYSDPHFGDEELAAGQVNRPDDAEQIARINQKVGRKDTLIILGDVGDVECVKKLRGYKILIMGNHDSGRTNYEEVFDEIYEGPLMISEKLILSHEPVDVPWAFNIHGHVHDLRHKNDKRHFNACAEAINFTPINFNQWMKQGYLSRIETIHRSTIDGATARKAKRGGKKING